jgi:N-acetylglucosaminyldiphosphoundecaprenol N-acetyl-beta-D-mannosaminyltransferase
MGCFVDNLTMQETVERIGEFISSGTPHQHVVINADKVVKANRDSALRSLINSCDLINADGMPVVWASYILGKPLQGRVTGIDLFFELLGAAEERGWRIYFLGAREEIVSSVVEKINATHPALNIAGYRNGYWSPTEEDSVAKNIADSQPDILFVAISSPKKEEFIRRHIKVMKVPFSMGVGGTFDIVAGKTKRAPVWMQKLGFEWFYRFLQEPRRMFARYFITDMSFFWLLLKEVFRTTDAENK